MSYIRTHWLDRPPRAGAYHSRTPMHGRRKQADTGLGSHQPLDVPFPCELTREIGGSARPLHQCLIPRGARCWLASHKAVATAIAVALQQKSATELAASGPGCQLRLLPNVAPWFIHEVYRLPSCWGLTPAQYAEQLVTRPIAILVNSKSNCY